MVLSKPIRWWPAILILLLASGALGWQWLREEATRQNRVMATMAVVAIAGLLLLLWLLLLSRLPFKKRLQAFALVLLVGAGTAFLVEVRGFTGDLVPLLGWRWGSGPHFGSESGKDVDPASKDADDYPQFLGPHRNATVPSARLVDDWESQPPQELWRIPVGAGWSSFAVVGGRAITQEQRGEQEVVVAYELLTGEPLWSFAYDAFFATSIGGTGPRATPTVADERVFTLGSSGHLHALALETGELLWERDLAEAYGAQIPDWGKSASPLVLGEQVIMTSTGGSGDQALLAFEASSGDLLWNAGSEGPSYSSPLLTTLGGVEQIVVFNEASITGHDASDGTPLWRYPWSKGQPNVAQPLPLSADRLLVSSGYGIGATALEISPDAEGDLNAAAVWQSPRLKLKFAQAVLFEGNLYGLDDGVLTCVDPETGERKWKRGRYGHGQILLAGRHILLQTESGDLVFIEPNPEELVELARIPVLDGRAWNTMALAGEYLLMRNDREAVCLKLAVDTSNGSLRESNPAEAAKEPVTGNGDRLEGTS